jgi:hypothetical protein
MRPDLTAVRLSREIRERGYNGAPGFLSSASSTSRKLHEICGAPASLTTTTSHHATQGTRRAEAIRGKAPSKRKASGSSKAE